MSLYVHAILLNSPGECANPITRHLFAEIVGSRTSIHTITDAAIREPLDYTVGSAHAVEQRALPRIS